MWGFFFRLDTGILLLTVFVCKIKKVGVCQPFYSHIVYLFLFVIFDKIDEHAAVEFCRFEFCNTTDWFEDDVFLWETHV